MDKEKQLSWREYEDIENFFEQYKKERRKRLIGRILKFTWRVTLLIYRNLISIVVVIIITFFVYFKQDITDRVTLLFDSQADHREEVHRNFESVHRDIEDIDNWRKKTDIRQEKIEQTVASLSDYLDEVVNKFEKALEDMDARHARDKSSIEDQLTDHEILIGDIQEKQNEFEIRQLEADDHYIELKGEMQESDIRMTILTTRLNDLKKSHEKSVDRTTKALANQNKQIVKIKGEISNIRRKLGDNDQKLKNLVNDLASLNDKYSKTYQKVYEIEGKMDELHFKVGVNDKALLNYANQQMRLQGRLDNLEKTNVKLREREKARPYSLDLGSYTNDLVRQLTCSEEQAKADKIKLKETQAQANSLTSDRNALRKALKKAKNDYKTTTKIANKLRSKIQVKDHQRLKAMEEGRKYQEMLTSQQKQLSLSKADIYQTFDDEKSLIEEQKLESKKLEDLKKRSSHAKVSRDQYNSRIQKLKNAELNLMDRFRKLKPNSNSEEEKPILYTIARMIPSRLTSSNNLGSFETKQTVFTKDELLDQGYAFQGEKVKRGPFSWGTSIRKVPDKGYQQASELRDSQIYGSE